LAPVPIGVTGELCVAGSGVARGYLGRPDLTASRFVTDPYGEPGDILYRTGDLARWLPDGTIDLLGRADHQVKLRGWRIELGEVEATLLTHPAVRQAAVLLVGGPGDERLRAFVSLNSHSRTSTPELRSFMALRLPPTLVPEIAEIPELPLTRSGKIDRAQLATTGSQRIESAQAYLAPKGAAERVLAAEWAAALGIQRVGTTDNFFNDLGGHSLTGAKLIAGLRDTFRTDVPLRLLFDAPTVATMATALGEFVGDRSRLERIAEIVETVHAYSDSELEALTTSNQRDAGDEGAPGRDKGLPREPDGRGDLP
jgi:acyl carrier protein